MKICPVDAVIIGGGIAGLWTLATLRQRGYRAVLLEKNALGSGQTLASQGIIHGGTKYALTGQLTGAARAIAAMPARWQAARMGRESIDLRAVELLSPQQYLWVNTGLARKLTAFFAGKVMHSRMQRVAGGDLPAFLPPDFAGHCYALHEPVFDVRAVLEAFAQQFGDAIVTHAEWTRTGHHFRLGEREQILAAHQVIYCAGKDNLNFHPTLGQLRPLHMTAVTVPAEAPAIFGHYLGVSDVPLLTVTTHPAPSGQTYYFGGQVAELGVARSSAAQIAAVQAVVAEALPWFPAQWWQHCPWTTFFIDRAEGANHGKRPDLPTIVTRGEDLVVFPTKLAFAPWVADRVVERLAPPAGLPPVVLPSSVSVAPYPWQR